jgi:hypothetical protein
VKDLAEGLARMRALLGPPEGGGKSERKGGGQRKG